MRNRNFWIFASLSILLLLPFSLYLKKKTTLSKSAPEAVDHPFLTKGLKEELIRLISGLEIKSCLDIPCGETSWIYEIKPYLQHYIGIDIQEKVLQKNREKYGTSTILFRNLEIAKDPLPSVELIFCHDLLNSLPQNEISAILLQFKKSGAKYLLLTHNADLEKNNKGKKGSYRPINWQLPPYNLSKPFLILTDPDHPNKTLALWRMEDI